jgi:hypothetical protein
MDQKRPIGLDIIDGRLAWVAEDGRTAPVIWGADGEVDAEPTEIEVPSDLATVEDPAELVQLRDSLRAEVRRIGELEDPTAEQIARASELAKAFTSVEAELGRREEDRTDRRTQLAEIVGTVGGDEPEGGEGEGGESTEGGETPPAEAPPAGDPAPVEGGEAPAPVAEAASSGPIRVPAVAKRPTLNPTLRQIAENAPPARLPDRRPEVQIYAAAEVPTFGTAEAIGDMEALVRATTEKANAIGVTEGSCAPHQLATIRRHYDEVVDEQTPMWDVDAALRRIIDPALAPGGMEALVAAGGWCAPSQIRYEFFNIAEGPQVWDVPRIGIQRGGLRWPDSLSLADFFALSGAPASGIPTNATMPWEWTEADDIATITGSGAKVCLRPPCPDFLEARLRAFGICVNAGNLTADAYPELISHYIRLVMIAHERVMNRRHIAQAVALATGVTPQSSTVDDVVPTMLGNADLYAIHTREKFGMSPNAVVEYVLPTWIRGPASSDMAKRNGYNPEQFRVGAGLLADWFDERRVRAQFVSDWQTLPGSAGPANTIGAATAPTNWPTSVLGLMYAAGTYFVGGGMNLRLGMIRDSVLNAENDHTAEWSEEATLVGMFGHEALLITNAIEAGGETIVLNTSGTNGP